MYTPLAFAYLLISVDSKPVLYLSINKLDEDLKLRLGNFLILKPIEEIDSIFDNLQRSLKIGFDFKNTSYYFYNLALQNNHKGVSLENPCLLPKATKNLIELEGSKKAHIRDGVSITKFLYWLKNHKNISRF